MALLLSLSTTTVVAVAIIIFMVQYHGLRRHHDPREPPLAHASIPLLGHTLGFIRHGHRYYNLVSNTVRLPAFTISMPGTKIYVVSGPDLISRLDRHYKTVSFAPIVANFSKAICGTSQEATDIQNYNILGEHGDGGLYHDISAGMREALQPGKLLDDMNRVMAQEVCAQLNCIGPRNGETISKIKLLAWASDVATLATTNAVYGPANPFKEQKVREAFHIFEKGMMRMLISPFPQYTARPYIAKREDVADAFMTYFADHHFEQGSGLVQTRWSHYVSNKVHVADVARFECGNAIALLVNTIPSVFWMLLSLQSVPGLLVDVREELDAVLIKDVEDKKKITIDINAVKHRCPLFMSTVKESLRHRAIGIITRKVVEDTMVNDYLLKKGAMLQVPISVVHNARDSWGANAATFDPQRFVTPSKPIDDDAAEKRMPNENAYRSFGGGKHLCPGRFFAQNEILAIVSLFVVRYDMAPVGGVQWEMPTTFNSNAVGQIATPDCDVEVQVSNRPGLADYTWSVEL